MKCCEDELCVPHCQRSGPMCSMVELGLREIHTSLNDTRYVGLGQEYSSIFVAPSGVLV